MSTAVVESHVVTALERLERDPEALLGWVPPAAVVAVLPGDPTARSIDAAVRRLVRRGEVELFDDRWPPTAPRQALRRVAS